MRFKLICLAFIALLLTGCASQTELLSVSMDKENQNQFSKILVLSISGNDKVRKTLETKLADTITKNGVAAQPAFAQIPGDLTELSKAELLAKVEEVVKTTGADAVLVAMLLKNEVREQYIAPQVNQVAVPSNMGFGPYVGYHYDTVLMPGYFSSQREVYVQTSLFDAASHDAVWRAQSKTINPSSLEKGVDDFSSVLVKRMKKDGMLKGSN